MSTRLILAAAALAWGSTLGAAERLPECEVIARVNGEVIQACELSWEVELMLQRRLSQLSPEARAAAPPEELEKARQAILRQLLTSHVDMALFYSDFRSSVPMANVAAIHESLEPAWEKSEKPRLRKQVGVETDAELEQRLVELGTSIGERHAAFMRKMIARSWLTESAEYEQEVTHRQMLEYYREHQEDYAFPARVRWEELVVRFDKHASKAAAWRAIAELGNQAHAASAGRPAGEATFAEIARRASDGFTAANGGAHKWTTRGAMAATSVDDQLFTLPAGQMSAILEGPTGFHIVRVLERRDAGVEPFRKVQQQIAAKIRDRRFDAAVRGRIAELKESARIWTAFSGDVEPTLRR